MNIAECKTIYDAAVAKKACKSITEAAKRYLDAGDVEGFERVCRGNLGWLERNKIQYILTDGKAERWHNNGFLDNHYTYINAKLHGLYECWHDNGFLFIRTTYVNGRVDGLYEVRNNDGTQRMRSFYVDNVKVAQVTVR